MVWRKDNEEILRDTESRTGSLFQLRRWTLELEDATEVGRGKGEGDGNQQSTKKERKE